MCQSTHLSDIHKICHSEASNHYLYPCPYIMPLWDKHIFITELLTGIHIMNSGFLVTTFKSIRLHAKKKNNKENNN